MKKYRKKEERKNEWRIRVVCAISKIWAGKNTQGILVKNRKNQKKKQKQKQKQKKNNPSNDEEILQNLLWLIHSK